MFDGSYLAAVEPRSFAIPVVDDPVGFDPGVPAVGVAQLRLRDSLDFTLDFCAWLAANGQALLSGATWAVTTDSPQTPTIVGQSFTSAGKAVVVLSPAVDAEIGDAYYLDVTAMIEAQTAETAGQIEMPVRRLVRRLHVVIVAG